MCLHLCIPSRWAESQHCCKSPQIPIRRNNNFIIIIIIIPLFWMVICITNYGFITLYNSSSTSVISTNKTPEKEVWRTFSPFTTTGSVGFLCCSITWKFSWRGQCILYLLPCPLCAYEVPGFTLKKKNKPMKARATHSLVPNGAQDGRESVESAESRTLKFVWVAQKTLNSHFQYWGPSY